jgi:uncharacterized protein YycO
MTARTVKGTRKKTPTATTFTRIRAAVTPNGKSVIGGREAIMELTANISAAPTAMHNHPDKRHARD